MKNRAPETRQILATIDGWALNWANTLLGLIFVVAIFASTKIQFDVQKEMAVTVTTNGAFQLDSPIDVAAGEMVAIDMEGKRYMIPVLPGEGQRLLMPSKPLPSELQGDLQMTYPAEVSLLEAVFNGLL